jgi:hypothetical protein
MIRVIVGTTTTRVEKNYSPATSLREILEDNAVDYSVAQVMLDGASLQAGDMDKTLADMNVTEKCMLIAVVKANNAR